MILLKNLRQARESHLQFRVSIPEWNRSSACNSCALGGLYRLLVLCVLQTKALAPALAEVFNESHTAGTLPPSCMQRKDSQNARTEVTERKDSLILRKNRTASCY